LIAKRRDSVYKSGRRSEAWVKGKLTQEQEFVIGGYTPLEKRRKCFGALLVGYYGPGGLLFARRVVTRFSEEAVATLYEGMQKIKREHAPSSNCPDPMYPQIWDIAGYPKLLAKELN
jgi:bifunctional non-homologous end joining protein LigD